MFQASILLNLYLIVICPKGINVNNASFFQSMVWVGLDTAYFFTTVKPSTMPRCTKCVVSSQNVNTVEPRYLELAYFELPLISKWKSGPCFNMKLWQQVTK